MKAGISSAPRGRWALELVQWVNSILRRVLYSSSLAARLLFGFTPARFNRISFFEAGTVAMKSVIAGTLHGNMRVLDVGTGPYAILAVWISQRVSAEVVATDIDPGACRWAAEQVKVSQARVRLQCTDLDENVDGRFDMIVFMTPGIPEEIFLRGLERDGIADPEEIRLLRLRSCGGPRGWELVDRFLARIPLRLAAAGRAYLCVNRFHLPLQTIRESIAAQGLRVAREYQRYVAFVIFVIERQDSQ